MVLVDPWYPATTPAIPDPLGPTQVPILTTTDFTTGNRTPELSERHIKEVKKGVLIKFTDGSWLFMATDDECYKKLKKELDDK